MFVSMTATVLARTPLNPGTDLWLIAGQGNPNTGLVASPALGGAIADPTSGSIYIQVDGLGGNQIWVKEGISNSWQLVAPQSPQVVQITTSQALSLTQSGCVIECNATTGPITITLPNLAADLRCDFSITKSDSSGNAVTIATSGDPYLSAVTSLATQGASVRVYAAPDGWVTAA